MKKMKMNRKNKKKNHDKWTKEEDIGIVPKTASSSSADDRTILHHILGDENKLDGSQLSPVFMQRLSLFRSFLEILYIMDPKRGALLSKDARATSLAPEETIPLRCNRSKTTERRRKNSLRLQRD